MTRSGVVRGTGRDLTMDALAVMRTPRDPICKLRAKARLRARNPLCKSNVDLSLAASRSRGLSSRNSVAPLGVRSVGQSQLTTRGVSPLVTRPDVGSGSRVRTRMVISLRNAWQPLKDLGPVCLQTALRRRSENRKNWSHRRSVRRPEATMGGCNPAAPESRAGREGHGARSSEQAVHNQGEGQTDSTGMSGAS